MNEDRQRAFDLVCAALRGDARTVANSTDADILWSVVSEHGVGPLLYAAIVNSARPPHWPHAFMHHLRRFAREQAALEMIQRDELVTALQALAAADIQCLLMKGAALAYTHYRSPEQRVRGDTDLLIPREHLESALDALVALGYRRIPSIDGELVMQQLQLCRTDSYGASHVIDLHWRISNPRLFAEILNFEELAANARPVAELGAGARGLGDAHALLLACVHRVAHHEASDRLIWIYDIHLLVQAMDQSALEEFAKMAAHKGMARVCADGVTLSGARLNTRNAAALVQTLNAYADAAGDEPSARYLRSNRREASLLLEDLRALPAWRARFRLLREHAFPSPEYMRLRYNARSARQLPWLYFKRAMRGVRRLFRRRRTP